MLERGIMMGEFSFPHFLRLMLLMAMIVTPPSLLMWAWLRSGSRDTSFKVP
jgi:hypothetical protein